jgi:anthranilate synthase component 2
MIKVLIIDNYDSFTYNLVQLVEEITENRPTVVRNDALDNIMLSNYTHVILSPGPGLPKEAGNLMQFITQLANSKLATLGVCLGHQAIAEYFGGTLINLKKVYHGVSSKIKIIAENKIFDNLTSGFEAGRYHSWVVKKDTFPSELEIICEGPKKEIMGLRHQSLPMIGVQFHPESILTQDGKKIISNFLTKS